VSRSQFDVLVVGAGPGGSIAATVLARGGARVGLVDKQSFPRDKACGDLIGPRGLRLLEDLRIDVPGPRRVGDMIVVGPTGKQVTLPCAEGATYPDHGVAIPRSSFDALLHSQAAVAGAEPMVARVETPRFDSDGALVGFVLSDGTTADADFIVGADGATSRVADVAGLVEPRSVLWGFALRAYIEDPVQLPHIAFWEPTAWRGFPGYGWLFPGLDGSANVGLGVGTLADRGSGAQATRAFDDFVDHLRHIGVLTGPPQTIRHRLGGWLKLGMVGTVPARGRVFLVGDAAGLVNPLQGEGISQAMGSGRAVGQAILAGAAGAVTRYNAFIAETYTPYCEITSVLHRFLLPHPHAVAAIGRLLTSQLIGRAVAPGWSIFWNDLLAGALPGAGRDVAALAFGLGDLVTRRGPTREWFDRCIGAGDHGVEVRV
jgi:geranylgeranyl reductase family protein